MATELDYALLAGVSYRSTRTLINHFPISTTFGWSEILYREIPSSGFEAVAFQKGTEIVISYAGTYDKSWVDKITDENLAAGVFNAQLLQAATLYLDIKASHPNVTLTGHSLGGGLASLIAVFFGENATTFDQAPFANAARSFEGRDVADTLLSQLQGLGYGEAALTGLTSFIQQRQSSGSTIPNADKVRNIIVAGEMLSVSPWNSLDRIGQTTASDTINNTATGASSGDLHAQALLTAFLQSQASNADQSLNKVTDKLQDLLKLMFEKSLFAHRTDEANDDEHKNLLEHLVRNEVLPEGNKMVTRFTADLWKLTPAGGLTMDDGLAYPEYSGDKPASHLISKAMMAFAMQKYYDETDHSKGLFNAITGGVSFSMGDVAPSWDKAKGKQYFDSYLANEFNGLSPAERDAIKAKLSSMKEWFVQVGTGGMNATATTKEAFMLGGKGADTLTGGSAADLLVGNAGADALNGGAGNDTLLGGTGNDTLLGGIGNDALYGGADNDELKGEEDNDFLNGGAGADTLWGGTGNDYLYDQGGSDTSTLRGDEGNDILEIKGGTGVTLLDGGAGNDILIGGAGTNSLDGGTGNDQIQGGADYDAITGGQGADYLRGGTGNDTYTKCASSKVAIHSIASHAYSIRAGGRFNSRKQAANNSHWRAAA